MKHIARLDYLDLQIYDGITKNLSIHQVDEEESPFSTSLFVNDALAHELLEVLGLPGSSSSWNGRVLYQTDNKELFIASKPLQKSLQFKGAFFLREDALEKLELVLRFLKSRCIKFLVSRIDLSFILKDSKIYRTMERCDFKRLTQYTLKKKKEIVYYKAYNSRFSLVVYGKSSQIKKEKGMDDLKNFLTHYELEELPDDLINLELRLLGTDSCAVITQILSENINLVEIKKEILKQTFKRVVLTHGLKNLLLKTSI